ncbi:MAG: hypothetical protein IJQ65_08410 [Kiritimatiellae bacterium]|nr:hypothetical protein [Kiritimatiellia bacterium]
MKNNIATALAVAFAFAANAAEKRWLGTDATSPTLASVAANWDPAGAPTADDDVVLDAGSNNNPMTWDLDNGVASWTQSDYTGTVTFKTGTSYGSYTCCGVTQADGSKALEISGNLTLSSGTWTHETTPSMTSTMKTKDLYKKGFGIYRLIVKVGGNCTIGASATINLDSKGFGTDGPGYKSDGSASHGGFGGKNYTPETNIAYIYGSLKEPISLGTGRTTRGGGAVRLAVSGSLTLDGTITAIGLRTGIYPGSGGSAWITAATLTGSGSVVMDGGGGTGAAYGCGGGGRLAVYLIGTGADFTGFTGTLTAKNANVYGTCGTVYLEKAADNGAGRLVLASGTTDSSHKILTYPRLSTPLKSDGSATSYSFSAIELDGYANLGIMPDVTVSVDGISGSSAALNMVTLYGGALTLRSDETFLLSKAQIRTFGEPSSLSAGVEGTNVLHLASGASLSVNVPTTLAGSLVVTGTVTHLMVSETSTNILDLSVSGDMTVASAGMVDVSNKGWPIGKFGPGAATTDNIGAVHAGTVPGSEKRAYGDPVHPTSHGSSGNKGAGGGVAKLTIAGTFTLNGKVRAYASDNNGGGCGAGGSVWITAAEVAGSGGEIDAKGAKYGGSAVQSGAGGSGGRIAVRQTVGNKTISEWGLATLTVAGGSSKGGTTSGGGTIYWEKASDGLDHGTLYMGGGNASAGPQLPPADAADAASLAGVKLSASDSGHLYIADDFTVGDFYLPSGGTIHLDGHKLTVAKPAQRKAQSVLGTVADGTIDDIVWPQRGLMFIFK